MTEKRRTTGPRIGPRLTAPQPAPPPTVMQPGGDRIFGDAREVHITQIRPDPDQPRTVMQPERLAELADSILHHGLLQPLVVRGEGLAPDGDMRYVIIAGGRRYAALQLLLRHPLDDATRTRLMRVRVIVNGSNAAERRVLQLIENLQREDLTPVEEARSLKEIMRVENLTTTTLAARVHRSQGYIDERLRLLRYEEIEVAVEAGWLTKSAGAAIASIASADIRGMWLVRAASGETIRARDVYASKKPVRAHGGFSSAEHVTRLPNFGKPTASTPLNDNALRDTDQAASPPGPLAGLPKFGNPATGGSVTPLPPDAAAQSAHTASAPALPNFGNGASASPSMTTATRGPDTVIRDMRMHLATLPLAQTTENRQRMAHELEAMLETIQYLLGVLQSDRH